MNLSDEDDQYDVIDQDAGFMLIEDDEEYSNEPVVTKDCIVNYLLESLLCLK